MILTVLWKVDQNPKFRAQQTFDENQAQNFAPATLDEAQEEEGQVEAVMDAALRPKRSLWRKMVMGGLALFGASVVGQGVQWTMNAWQTQDWVALGGCAAGALIIGAGVGSVVTEWRRLWRLRQRAHERDEARDLLHSHGTGKGRAFCEKLAQQAGIDQSHPALQRWYASIHETQNDRGSGQPVCAFGPASFRCPGAARNQPFGGGINVDDCGQPAGVGRYGVYRLAQSAFN